MGAIIITEDTPADYSYLIVEGAVDVYREERRFLLDTLSSGGVFGIMSLMERKPRSATVEARTPLTVIKLDLLNIRNSLPEGMEIYERIIINQMNNLESMVRSTDSLAIEEMKANQEELRVRVSFGKFFASLVLLITAHFVIGRRCAAVYRGSTHYHVPHFGAADRLRNICILFDEANALLLG
jgi:CRP-like cAMP-binding protein